MVRDCPLELADIYEIMLIDVDCLYLATNKLMVLKQELGFKLTIISYN